MSLCPVRILVIATLFIVAAFSSSYATESSSGLEKQLTVQEILSLGEKMYREGILPDGKPMAAFIRGDVEVDSRAFSCSSCHLRAGLGSVEGGVVTPPTTGKKLYQAYRRPPSLDDIPDKAGRYVYAKTVLERPAYTRESLMHGLRFGEDPAGQKYNDVMPRYPLSDGDMEILVRYLELLSAEPSPGAGNKEFHFATVIAGEVSKEDRDALLKPLLWFIDQKNRQMALYQEFLKFDYSPTIDMRYAFHNASLDIWELKGAPETWEAQLAEYVRKKPVFAVLGGISNGSWQPVHRFCEQERIPCLFPITDFPVVSDSDWYTLYFNKGFFQEGEAAARYLNRQQSENEAGRILQVVEETAEGKALAEGFNKAWADLGHRAVNTVVVSQKDILEKGFIPSLMDKHRPQALVLWTDAWIFKTLKSAAGMIDKTTPVILSAGYLGQKSLDADDAIRERLYFTYPYRLTPYVGTKDGVRDVRVPIVATYKDLGDRRIASRTVSMLQQAISRGLNLIYDNLYRDHLLDVMSMQMDMTVRDYERLSFGPGQRYGSKGCYIMQLGSGKEPAIIPVSDWVTH